MDINYHDHSVLYFRIKITCFQECLDLKPDHNS